MRLSRVGERRMVASLRKSLRRSGKVLTRLEEDAEIIGKMAITTDMSAMGNHFQTKKPEDIGHKIVVSTLTDLLAKGALPEYMMSSIGLPRGLDDTFVRRLYRAMDRRLSGFGAYLIGGDMVETKELVIDSVAWGRLSGKPVLRSGARPGDSVVLTGEVGGAALGYKMFKMGLPKRKEFIQKQLRPDIDFKLCKRLMRSANAGMDISDGLGFELNTIASQSGVRMEIDDVPVSKSLRPYCERHGLDADELIWHCGEDYQIVYTIPGYEGKYKIGEVKKGRGVYHKGRKISTRGWQNFLY